MEIHIVENEKNLRVVIECRQVDEQVTRLKSHIELFDNKPCGFIQQYRIKW